MARVRDQLTALADEEAARGASEAAVEAFAPFGARNAEVSGQAMLPRTRVVVTTPKGRDQAPRQAEALRQNGTWAAGSSPT
jgi:hypothetical protein